MVRHPAHRCDSIEVAAQFGGADLVGDVVASDVVRKCPFGQVDRGNGSDPCLKILFEDRDFTEQVEWGLA